MIYNSPGVYISTSGGNVRTAALFPFKFAYMVGYSSTGARNRPTLVRSVQDFVNQFGTSSKSIPSVRLYYANNPNGILQFINTAIAKEFTLHFGLTPETNLSVGTKTVSINGRNLNLDVIGGQTSPASNATAFKALLDNDLVLSNTLVSEIDSENPERLIIRQVDPAHAMSVVDLPSLLTVATVSPASITINVGTPSTGQQAHLNVLGELVSVTADADPVAVDVRDALMDEINSNPALDGAVVAVEGLNDNQLVINSVDSQISVSGVYVVKEITAFETTPDSPRISDLDYALSVLDPEVPPGFLMAPEYFLNAQYSAEDRQSIATILEGFASDEKRNWLALIDCGPKAQVPTYVHAMAEAAQLTSPQGHSAYYYPYFVDVHNVEVPPSAAVASVAVRKYRLGGFAQPPAGIQTPVLGVRNISIPTHFQEQEIASLQKVNFLRVIPNNGICIFDDLTLSSDPLFSAINTRVILNILLHTLKGQFMPFLFQSIDGTGQYFSALETTATHTLELMRSQGLLYGATPADAYRVQVNRTSAVLLEAGIVDMRIYVVPAPRARQIMINVIRSGIGQIPSLSFQLADINANAPAIPLPQPGTPGENN